ISTNIVSETYYIHNESLTNWPAHDILAVNGPFSGQSYPCPTVPPGSMRHDLFESPAPRYGRWTVRHPPDPWASRCAGSYPGATTHKRRVGTSRWSRYATRRAHPKRRGTQPL